MAKKEDPHNHEGFGPLQSKMLVKPDSAETITPGGLILPGAEGQTINQGIIVAVGPKVQDRKVGDHVMYGIHAGIQITWKHMDYLLIREDDAYAVLK
jgi:co-chaperonin GroES (HSP10)